MGICLGNDVPKLMAELEKVKDEKARIDSAWSFVNEYTNCDEEAYLLQEIIKLSTQIKDKDNLAEAYNMLARHTYNTMSCTPDTLEYFLRKVEELNLTSERASSLLTDMRSYVCYSYIFSNMTGKALDITYSFLEDAERSDDAYAKLTANEMIGTLYAHISQTDEAIKHLSEAYKIYNNSKESSAGVGLQLQMELSDAYLQKNDFKNLRTIINDMQVSMKEYSPANYGFYYHNHAMIESCLALCDVDDNLLSSAWNHIEKSKTLTPQNDTYIVMIQKYSEAFYYYKKENYEKAWELITNDEIDSDVTFYLLFKIDLLEKMEKWKEVAEYRKKLLDDNKEKTDLLLNSQFNEMRVKYDTSNLEIKNSRIERNQAELRARFYGVAFGLMLLIGSLLTYIYIRTKKDKEKIEVANKSQKIFLQNMSHEIRTPLNAICGFSQLLSSPDMRSILSDEEYAEYADIIQGNTDLLTTLVTDILVSSDLESGKYKLNIHPCSANNICRHAMNTVKSRCPNHIHLYFTSDIPEDYRFNSDEMRCQQILINYLTNAIKHTEQGEIHVDATLKEQNGYITFSVTDTGTGVPADKANTIFERFEKLNTFTQGTGLGLNICKKLATLMHGNVFLDTSYQNGARFVFNHPCVA